MRRFTWNSLSGLLSIKKKKIFVSLSNHYMVWNSLLNNDMKNLTKLCCQMSLKINEVDKYIYMNNTNKGYVIVYFYMDDMLTLDRNDHMIKYTKKMWTNKFDMKNLGVANVTLGIKISRTFEGLILS
jgi:hypothetical protein